MACERKEEGKEVERIEKVGKEQEKEVVLIREGKEDGKGRRDLRSRTSRRCVSVRVQWKGRNGFS